MLASSTECHNNYQSQNEPGCEEVAKYSGLYPSASDGELDYACCHTPETQDGAANTHKVRP